MPMKQTIARTSIYSADVFGVCSALFELGGMIVIHDPSGCNSTYTTHDEPRWYDMDSLLFISGLTEIDAVVGNDNKLVHDIVKAARDFSPRFIVVLGTPVPYMTGMDLSAVAGIIEKQIHIPTYFLPTNSMHSYISGASMAFAMLAENIAAVPVKKHNKTAVNILGMTPLDFSANGSDEAIRKVIGRHGFDITSVWAMGNTLDEISQAAAADVNLVVSASGMEAARILQQRFGIPYVVGVPIGTAMTLRIAADLKMAAQTNRNIISYAERQIIDNGAVIIGESVYSASLAMALETESALPVQVLCPLEAETGLLGKKDAAIESEIQLMEALKGRSLIIADPLYKPICPEQAKFVPLPHEAFSGRLFRKSIPNLIADFDDFLKKINPFSLA